MKYKIQYIILLIGFVSFSQSEGSYWFFNQNAGVNFNFCDNNVVTDTNGMVISDETGFEHFPSAISDKYGNLLFYSDSRTIWNKNHTQFPNASLLNGTDLKGFKNSIILPKPNNPGRYFIFTIDFKGPNNLFDDGENSGLNYSEIDMSLDNGLGDVIPSQKNIELITYNPLSTNEAIVKTSWMLTAVRGSDCNSYWIITHFLSNFYAFKMDENGVNPNPIISTVAPLQEIGVFNSTGEPYYHGHGQLKSSPDGTKIAIAHGAFISDTQFADPGSIHLYDFDNNTGIIDNRKDVFFGQNGNDYPVTLEFSALSDWLYAITSEGNSIDFDVPKRFLRWDLNADSIADSMEILEEQGIATADALQLGNDNKIYRTNLTFDSDNEDYLRYMSVVSNPDVNNLDNINYIEFSFLIDINEDLQNTVRTTLPQINRQWFNRRIDIVNNGLSKCEVFLCGGQSKNLTANNIDGATYTWLKDSVVLNDETGFILEVNSPGFYEVFIEPNDGGCPIEGSATVLLSTEDIPVANDATIFQCDDDTDNITTFNLSEIIQDVSNDAQGVQVRFYETFANAENEVAPIPVNYTNTSNPQIIYAVVKNTENGCINISEVTLEVSSTNANNATLEDCDMGDNDGLTTFNLTDANDSILAGLPDGLTVTYYSTYENALVESFPLDTSFSNTTPYSQTVYARVENENACYGISELQLSVYELPNVETNETLYYCLNTSPETIVLTGGVIDDLPNNYYYEWSTSATTSEIEVNEPGTYTVRVSNTNGCFVDRTVNVLPSNIATITDILVTDATSNNSILVEVTGEGTYEYALDNPIGPYQDSSLFENVAFGFHTVYVRDTKNDCGTVEELVSVIGIPKFFTPNGDTHNIFWNVKGISTDFQPNTQILIFDRYGKLLIELDPLSSGWDGTFNGFDMPTNDYWYVITLEDGRVLKGHFTLKR
ncbi:T9SS type B sorting domain-containing protein [uncultured Psychroserpens sp.]|uniref:T9SS type B sorting domain-containing protein n=1 Tax=uncultured Psychroserpens sp. TaxID=255436 RepID=UPI002620E8D6|nr:T9SS type B sorting domain-containing protein [uncultured Psychroserpens sp.]